MPTITTELAFPHATGTVQGDKETLQAQLHYTKAVELPLIITLIIFIWIAIGVRIWAVHKHLGWRTYHGVSTSLVFFSGIISTLYPILLQKGKNNFANNISPQLLAGKGDEDAFMKFYDPADYIFAARMLLNIVLWTVKLAFLIVFFEARQKLDSKSRIFLYCSVGYITAGFTTSVTELANESALVAQGALFAFRETGAISIDIPNLNAEPLAFSLLGELIVCSLNIVADLLMLYAAIRIVKALGFPLRSSQLLVFMVAVTTVIAVVRVILAAVLFQGAINRKQINMTSLVYSIFSEIETYVAVVVATFPSFRVLFRPVLQQRKDSRKVSTSSSSSAEDGTSSYKVYAEGKIQK